MTKSRYVSGFLAIVLMTSATAPAFVRLPEKARKVHAKPVVAKNLPTMKGIKGGPGRPIKDWNNGPAPTFPTSGSLLDETGHLCYAPNADQIAGWRKSKLPQDKLFLAELTLGLREPAQAEEVLNQLIMSEKPGSPTRGLARRAKAFALHCQGRYREATNAFANLRRSNEVGIDRRALRVIEKHSFACAGYHSGHAKLGIPQAGRVDPLSGIRSVAKALTRFGKTYDEVAVAKAISHDGMGTQGRELKEGIEKLGYSAFAVKGQTEIVKHLPLPLVAFVEHDHYVSVTRADEKGVSIWCVDCGGERPLSWKQWDAMDAEMLIAVVQPGSEEERMLEAAFDKEMQKFASIVPPFNPFIGVTSLGWRIPPESLKHGALSQSAQCDPCEQSCPTVRTLATGKPVNVATGAEEYEPEPDLVVYNPEGPDVTWGRLYMSAGNAMDNGFGDNWSHPYNMVVNTYQVSGGGNSPTVWGIDIVLPSSAHIKFGLPAETSPPTAQNQDPVILQPAQPGRKMRVTWKWDSTNGYDYFEILDGSQNVIRTTALEYFNRTTNFQWPNSYVSNGNIYRMQSLTDPFGKAITFHYADYSRKVVLQENYGQTSTSYPTVKDLQYIKDADGDTLLTLNYMTGQNESGRLASVVDRYGRKVHYTVSYHASQLPSVSQAEGTPAGVWAVDEVSQIVPSNFSGTLPVKNQYGYELVANGKLGEAIASVKTISVISPTGSGMSTATLHYDTDGSINKVTDANGYVIEIDQDEEDPKATITHKTSGGTTVKTYTVQWDNYMNLEKVWDADGEVVLEKSFTNSVFKPTSVTDAYNHTWTFQYDEFGNMEWSNTPRGIQTTYDWDYDVNPLGRLMEVEVEGKSLTTSFTYYSNGKVETIQSPNPNHDDSDPQNPEPNYVTTEFTYNGYGDVLTVESPGNNAESVHTTTYDYGSTPKKGQPLSITNSEGEETEFTYDDQGNVLTVEDPLGNLSETSYNIANQPETHILPETNTSGSDHAFSVTTYLFPGGMATGTLSYDEGDNEGPIRSVAYDFGWEGELLGVEGDTELSTRTYDAAYNLITLTDGAGSGHTTTYTYNTKGLCTEIDYPGATGANFNQVRFTYNKNGQVTNREDGNNVDTVYVYDEPDGGLTKIDYASGTDTEFDYDDYGRVTLVTDATGTSSSTYDELDMLQSSTRTYTGLSGKTFDYGYYRDGSRRTMVNPGGTWDYSYDKVGRYTSMSNPLGTVSSVYDDNGRQTKRTLPNGAYTDVAYNAVGVPTSWLNKKSDNTTLSQWGSFGYDGVFNLVGATHSNSIATTNFNGDVDYTLDAKDRLTQEVGTRCGGYTETNVWDAASNPTTFRGNSGRTYNGSNQRSNTGYAYDGNGNPTTYAGTTCTYDVENRLTAFGSEAYSYRADGLRASVGSGTSKVYYLYDQGNAVCQLDYQGSLLRTYVYAPDGMVGRTGSSQTRYYLFDWQGNVEHSMSSSTNLNVSYAFNAWGQRNQKFPVNADVGANDQFGYNARWGYMRENTTGFYYCQNRYYDPANGRWLTRDPIGFAGGINMYGYCGSGPVGFADQNGLGFWRVVGGIVGGATAGIGGLLLTGNPYVAWVAGTAGTALGSTLGSLADGDSIQEAAVNGATDGALSAILGPILGKCFSIIRGVSAGRKAAQALGQFADDLAFQSKAIQAAEKVPGHWNVRPANNGGGLRFSDPANPHTHVRIDPGHAHVSDGGRAIGVGGIDVSAFPRSYPGRHIPLDDWFGWRWWNRP